GATAPKRADMPSPWRRARWNACWRAVPAHPRPRSNRLSARREVKTDMLQRLDLNHATAVRQHHPLAIGLLLAGMLAVIALFLVLQHLDRRQTLLEEDMLRLRQPGTVQSARPDGKENTARREEITAVRTVLDELALPWQPLFTT